MDKLVKKELRLGTLTDDNNERIGWILGYVKEGTDELLAHVAVFPEKGKPFLLSNAGPRLAELRALTEQEKQWFGPNGEQFFDVIVEEPDTIEGDA